MDGSTTRRGQPCWHVKEDIGVAAFNDSILLEAAIYSILEKHFKGKDYYHQIIEEFHTVGNLQTIIKASLKPLT